MKLSYLWLKEFVDFDLSPEETGALLRRLGFELVSVTRFGGDLPNVVVAKVEAREKHPNADKLSLCKVFDGKERLDIVCGAPNVAAGQTVALAKVGAELPGGVKISKAVIRGQESSGMLCSTRELGLSEEHAGIMVLPDELQAGRPVGEALALNDAVIEVEVTPNRPDALSHWGMAREIAAELKKKLRLPDMSVPKAKAAPSLVKLSDKACSRYIGRVIEGAAVRPSPLWMRLRLERCGIRAISNVVDVTNYVLLELGHPLHAFDRDKLAEGRVVVRRGADGESLECLDGVKRPVAGAMVIADAERPAALAGIIGGQPTAVGEGTKNLLLESAVFQPSAVRRARGAAGVSTESSYRFERGTDWEVCDWASRRAAKLILELAGGKLVAEQDARGLKPAAVAVKVSPERVNALLGTKVPAAEMKKSLALLGFSVTGGAELKVVPPVHRQDVREEPDVAEEIGRLVGYDKIATRVRPAAQAPEPETRERKLLLAARGYFTGLGFFEARNYGLISRQLREMLHGPGGGLVELDNPISLSGELLTPELSTHLLANVQTNLRRGAANVRLFETARVFHAVSPVPQTGATASADGSRVVENLSVAWVASGAAQPAHWKHHPRPLDIWDAKGWMKSLLLEWRSAGVRFDKAEDVPFLHPSESQSVVMENKRIGYFGRLHPRVAASWDLPADTFLAELDLSAVARGAFLEPHAAALPKHPAVLRDFSLVFPEDVTWSSIAHWLFRKHERIENVELFDVFKDASMEAGRPVPQAGTPPIRQTGTTASADGSGGRRSLAFRVWFRHPERSMTDAEVGEIQKSILEDLKSQFQGELRASPNTQTP